MRSGLYTAWADSVPTLNNAYRGLIRQAEYNYDMNDEEPAERAEVPATTGV